MEKGINLYFLRLLLGFGVDFCRPAAPAARPIYVEKLLFKTGHPSDALFDLLLLLLLFPVGSVFTLELSPFSGVDFCRPAAPAAGHIYVFHKGFSDFPV